MQKFAALWAAVKALFSKSTVDSLISDVEQRVTHLTVVADAKAVEQKVHAEALAARQRLYDAASREEARARAIAAKFKALISEF